MRFSKEWFKGAFSKSYLWIVLKRFLWTFACGAAVSLVAVLDTDNLPSTWEALLKWLKMLGCAAGTGGLLAAVKWLKFSLTQFSLSNNNGGE
jgi:hypothetical protein